MDIESGALTMAAAVEIQSRLKVIGYALSTGDWKSAQLALSQILPNVHCTKTRINALMAEISAYVTANYGW